MRDPLCYCFCRYYKLWQFLNLDEVTTVTELIGEGKRVCGMTHEELSAYNHGRHKYEKNVKYLPKYCFMSSYITTLLKDGFDFPTEEHIHFVDEVGGYKVRAYSLSLFGTARASCVGYSQFMLFSRLVRARAHRTLPG